MKEAPNCVTARRVLILKVKDKASWRVVLSLPQWVWGGDEALDGLWDALRFTVAAVGGQCSSWQRDRVSFWLSWWPPRRHSLAVRRPHWKCWNIQRYTRIGSHKKCRLKCTLMLHRKLTSASRDDPHLFCNYKVTSLYWLHNYNNAGAHMAPSRPQSSLLMGMNNSPSFPIIHSSVSSFSKPSADVANGRKR